MLSGRDREDMAARFKELVIYLKRQNINMCQSQENHCKATRDIHEKKNRLNYLYNCKWSVKSELEDKTRLIIQGRLPGRGAFFFLKKKH